VDPNDVENESQDPDIAAPSLNSSASAASDSEAAEADEPPRKKQRQNPTGEFSASPPLSPAPNKNGTELKSGNDSPKEGKTLNYNLHPHFRSEFCLPMQEFHTLMHQRALKTDPVTSSGGNSPEPESVELSYATVTKATGRKGRPPKKSQQAAKAEESMIVDVLGSNSEESAPALGPTAGNEDEAERTGSPARSPRAKGGAKRRGRTRSVSAATKPKQQPPPFGDADSDSSLSEPDEAGAEELRAEGEEQQDEEAVESIFSGATPAEQTDDEAPSAQGTRISTRWAQMAMTSWRKRFSQGVVRLEVSARSASRRLRVSRLSLDLPHLKGLRQQPMQKRKSHHPRRKK
jgi:hypothetical protein